MRLPVTAITCAVAVVACSKSTRGEGDGQLPSVTVSAAPSRSSPPASAFDALWGSAQQRDRFTSFDAALTAFVPKSAYCGKHNCGDQFEPDKKYKDDVAEGKTIVATTWRLEIEDNALRVGPFNAQANSIPFLVTWPINENYSQFATRKGWPARDEKLAEMKFRDGAEARSWSENNDRFYWRMVFNIVGGATDSFGEGVLLVKILGQQICTKGDGHGCARVWFEQPSGVVDGGTASQGVKP